MTKQNVNPISVDQPFSGSTYISMSTSGISVLPGETTDQIPLVCIEPETAIFTLDTLLEIAMKIMDHCSLSYRSEQFARVERIRGAFHGWSATVARQEAQRLLKEALEEEAFK